MIKKIGYVFLFLCTLLLIMQVDVVIGGTGYEDNILSDNCFIDDMGNKIYIKNGDVTIISLSATHTENIFELGGNDYLIGVGKGSIYPYDVIKLKTYDISKAMAVEEIISLKPDYLLIEPQMNSDKTGLISKFESAGLQVISLLPDSPNDFTAYIKKLSMLIHKESVAEEKLNAYYMSLREIQEKTKTITPKKTVFVEQSEKGYYSVGKGTLIGQAVNLAGGKLLIKSNDLLTKANNLLTDDDQNHYVGIDFILKHQNEIDTYFTVRGKGFSGASLISISQKDEFKDILAVKNHQVYEILSPLASQYTFRYVTGVLEFARLLYKDQIESPSDIEDNEIITRSIFAEVIYKQEHLPTFTIIDSSYYDYEKYYHSYGSYEDVSFKNDDFNIIETITMYGYIKPITIDGNKQLFNREDVITRSDMARFIYIYLDLDETNINEKILDIDNDPNKHIIEKVVNHSLMTTQDGYFDPYKPLLGKEFKELLNKIREVKK